MIKERVAELSAALRSGEYEQGQRLLCRKLDDGTKTWCCLGVACDLAVKAGVEVTVAESIDFPWDGADRTYRKILWDGNDGILPHSVMNYFGFKDEVGTTSGPRLMNPKAVPVDTLTRANDTGVTFTQIADFIDANWAQL